MCTNSISPSPSWKEDSNKVALTKEDLNYLNEFAERWKVFGQQIPITPDDIYHLVDHVFESLEACYNSFKDEFADIDSENK